jgi:hypothetical protein
LLTGPNGEPARLPVLKYGVQVLERRGLPQRVGYVRAEVVLVIFRIMRINVAAQFR